MDNSDGDNQQGQRSSKRSRVDDREAVSEPKVTCKCRNCTAKKVILVEKKNGVFCSKMCHPIHCTIITEIKTLQNNTDKKL